MLIYTNIICHTFYIYVYVTPEHNDVCVLAGDQAGDQEVARDHRHASQASRGPVYTLPSSQCYVAQHPAAPALQAHATSSPNNYPNHPCRSTTPSSGPSCWSWTCRLPTAPAVCTLPALCALQRVRYGRSEIDHFLPCEAQMEAAMAEAGGVQAKGMKASPLLVL